MKLISELKLVSKARDLNFDCYYNDGQSEVYSEPCQISKMELFGKQFFLAFTNLAKCFILNVW